MNAASAQGHGTRPSGRSAASGTGDFGGFDDDLRGGAFPDGGVPPLVLVTGPERVLADRAIDSTLAALRTLDPQIEVVRLDASTYETGLIARHTSPSLFGGSSAVLVRDVDEAGDDLVIDLLEYVTAPADTVTLIVWHKSGNRGKKVLDAMKKGGARVLKAPAVKSDRDKAEFVAGEFRRHGRRIDAGAVRDLIEAVGRDVAELAAACRQLISDTTGTVEYGTVETYYGGRITANGFRVADAALAGNVADALALVRHAVAVGTDPVPIVAAIAVQVRQLVKVLGAAGGSAGQVAGVLGMAPWQVERARRSLRGWSEEGLAAAITAAATADFDVKGGSRDPVYAVEKCVIEVTRARRLTAATRRR